MDATTKLYHKLILETLAAAGGLAMTEGMLADRLEVRTGQRCDLSAMRDALERHVAADHVRSRMNQDIEEREWLVTAKGAAKNQIQ